MGYTTRRRIRVRKRPISKNAATLINLRGIDPTKITGEGKITLPMVEQYLRSLSEAEVPNNSVTQKPIQNGEAKIDGHPEEE